MQAACESRAFGVQQAAQLPMQVGVG